jgi:TonB-dependent receptor
MKKLLLIFTFLISTLAAFSQISGTITDSISNEPVIGVMVLIQGETGKGAITDINGKFELKNLDKPTYTLEVRYIGYHSQFITVTSKDTLNIKLKEKTLEIGTVTVRAKVNKESTTELVRQQSNSAVVQDGVNAETFKKTPDTKVSDVFKRVSGASVQDNKFVVIRGLNDRYNFALINGSPLPSSESDRKAFSFDIFPSNMLDNLIVMKSGSPDMPGEFAGGVINISTSEPKDSKFQNIQFGLGFNTISTFQNFKTYQGSSTDFLGFGSNYRGLPSSIPSTLDFSALNKAEKADLSKMINTSWSTRSRIALPIGSLQYSVGRYIKFKKDNSLGITFAYSYQNASTMNNSVRREFEEQADGVVQKMELKDSVFTQTVLNSAMLNFTYQINDNNTIRFKNLYSINSEDKVNVRNGVREMDNDPRQWERSTNFWYTQNNLLTQQLSGKHDIKKTKLNWNLGFSDVKRDIPNLRRLVYRKYSLLENDTTEQWTAIIQQNGTIPTAAGNMFWSKSSEKIYSANYDWTIPVKFGKIENEFKVGGWHQYRTRDFLSRNLGFSQYKPTGNTFNSNLLLLGPDEIFSQQNMGLLENGQGGFKLDEATNVDDSYQANSFLNAAFAMTDTKVGDKLRIIGGLRIESYNQQFNYIEFGSNEHKHIDTTVVDFLPSVNIVYSLNKKMKVRGSYYRTVSRPEFRELAPFSFYNFVIDNIVSGNPNLKRATIDNFDVRWEMYPGKGQIISVSGFYKTFENPIELINRTGTSGAPELYFTNVNKVTNIGGEIEFRFNLGTFTKVENKLLDNLTVYSNASIIKSVVDMSHFVGSGDDRPLQGQSPYIINSGIFYTTPKKDLTATISYNVIGQRIYIVGNVQEPSVWENGRNVIDLQVSKKIGEKIELKLNVKDLLAQDLVYFQDLNGNKKYDKGIDNNWQEIKFGQTVSMSVKYTF